MTTPASLPPAHFLDLAEPVAEDLKGSVDDRFNALLTIMRHRETVAEHLHNLADYFRHRAREHDRSKLRLDEFAGFSRINRIAREHPYGTQEYEESMDTEKGPDGCITLHFSRNAHHPEYHGHEREMGLLDLMEMVADWKGAADTYGTNTLRDAMPVNRKRFDFDDWQWRVIELMVDWLEPENPMEDDR